MTAEGNQHESRPARDPARAAGRPLAVLPYRTADPRPRHGGPVGPALLVWSVFLLAGGAGLLYVIVAKPFGRAYGNSGWYWATRDSAPDAGPLRNWSATVGLSGRMGGNRPEMVRAAMAVLLVGVGLWQLVDAVRLTHRPPTGSPWSAGPIPLGLWTARRFAQTFHVAILLGVVGGAYLELTAKPNPAPPRTGGYSYQSPPQTDSVTVPVPVSCGAWVLVAAANLAVLRSPSRAFRITMLVTDAVLLALLGLAALRRDVHPLPRAAATVAVIGLAVSLLAVAADPWTESRRRAMGQGPVEVGGGG